MNVSKRWMVVAASMVRTSKETFLLALNDTVVIVGLIELFDLYSVTTIQLLRLRDYSKHISEGYRRSRNKCRNAGARLVNEKRQSKRAHFSSLPNGTVIRACADPCKRRQRRSESTSLGGSISLCNSYHLMVVVRGHSAWMSGN